MSSVRSKSLCTAALLLSACTSEAKLVASNCEMGSCLKTAALKIDAVDILLVVDDSRSVISKAKQLKAELPRLLTAITTGEADDVSFPPAKSVHVAVTTTDMGGAYENSGPSCYGSGQDGVFLKPGDRGVTCDIAYPGYLSYEAESVSSATESASCVPLVYPEYGSDRWPGCGYEQPLEAALKSVWSEQNTALSFTEGAGHGDGKNAGFLRDNSLLIVVVVSDEDDCSVSDRGLLRVAAPHPYDSEPVNLRCYLHPEKLQAPSRYIDHLKALRPNNDNVIFTVIGGIPPEMASDDFRSKYDFTMPEQADQYFADILDAGTMQEAAIEVDGSFGRLQPSCSVTIDGQTHEATPPRRLVEVARGFGAQGVLGSICAEEFGTTTGQLIRAVAEKLNADAAR